MMAMLRLRPGLRAVMTYPQISGSSLAHEIAVAVVVVAVAEEESFG